MISVPDFGETPAFFNQTNASSRVWTVEEAQEELFERCCAALQENGFEKKETRIRGRQRYAAFTDGKTGVFVNDFRSIRTLSIVAEDNCRYFDYHDEASIRALPAQITQMELEDFGLSYIIRLSDGRVIVIDGGNRFEPDADRLLTVLRENAADQKPVIAAWIFTHPHSDHFHCFLGFMDRYADQIVIEKALLNFPEADDLAHYPALANKDRRLPDTSGPTNIPLLWNHLRACGAEVYMPRAIRSMAAT